MQSVLILALAWIATGAAGEPPAQRAIRLEFSGSVVTIVADHARATDVLAEWARVGDTDVIGADLLSDRTVTLNLTRVDEQDALTQVVGAGFGFIGPLKEASGTGTSRFSRIIVSTTKPRPAEAARPSSVPETIFDYTSPAKWVEPGVDPESPPVAVRPTGAVSGDPEVLFEYTTPKQFANPPANPEGATAPARTDGPRVDPEARFDYLRSSKTYEPPKKESSDAAGCTAAARGTSKEKCGG